MSDELLWRSFAPDLEVRSGGDGRTIMGIVAPFASIETVSDGGPAYREAFQRGAFAKTISERQDKVKLLAHHDRRSNPLGRSTLLREDSAGLYGEFKVSNTRAGDETLELVKDGALDSFSVGFRPIQQANRDGVKWRTEVALNEVSLVTIPAYAGALVSGVRALLDEQLDDDEARALAERIGKFLPILRSDTPEGEPSEQITPSGADHAEAEPTERGHSLKHTHLKLAHQAREKGVI